MDYAESLNIYFSQVAKSSEALLKSRGISLGNVMISYCINVGHYRRILTLVHTVIKELLIDIVNRIFFLD